MHSVLIIQFLILKKEIMLNKHKLILLFSNQRFLSRTQIRPGKELIVHPTLIRI